LNSKYNQKFFVEKSTIKKTIHNFSKSSEPTETVSVIIA